jgi:hypothetical protein
MVEVLLDHCNEKMGELWKTRRGLIVVVHRISSWACGYIIYRADHFSSKRAIAMQPFCNVFW